MRDPDRIKPLLKQIEEYWLKHPGLRLAQLISNANRTARANQNRPLSDDVFYLEDHVLSGILHDENT